MLHHLETTKKQFIGKIIDKIERDSNSSVLVSFSDKTKVKISVEGDCCSHSIFYGIDIPKNFKGAVLEDIIENEYEDDSVSKTTADTEREALEKVKNQE